MRRRTLLDEETCTYVFNGTEYRAKRVSFDYKRPVSVRYSGEGVPCIARWEVVVTASRADAAKVLADATTAMAQRQISASGVYEGQVILGAVNDDGLGPDVTLVFTGCGPLTVRIPPTGHVSAADALATYSGRDE